MSFDVVANYLFIICVAFANGMPQNNDATSRENSGSLPFLQFTNKGIRVNFAGYHAEAGLGGLLRGAGTGGGLHASVGTPWGGHAGAGLGGEVSGEDGTVGGGLYARAGLGHGRPEAAAGIGGKLDGSGRSLNPISGGMYAGATPGGGPGTGVYLGGGYGKDGVEYTISSDVPVDASDAIPQPAGTTTTKKSDEKSAGTDEGADETKPTRGRTNIQIIPRKEKEKVTLVAAASPADALADGKAESKNSEVRRTVQYTVVPPAAQLDVIGSISAGAVAPAVKTVEKTIVVPAPPPFVTVQGVAQANANTNVTATVDNNTGTVSRITYPRWYFRKRFRNVPRKTVYLTSTATDSETASSNVNSGVVAASKTYTSGSLFNDIFNIPISTLTAVNQLLNNVG
ncbi:uncharacterized protein LOC116845224 isoform X2 [Odontomachus brunneus]|uniref:uncharacterized protein LOC116845224 isoform X2 n=1 Tax=Odontomachus brunneus TaxID=486640 RepID=UPI0013F25ACD|nr:uncharacterized protein LOC116845224 isoform X2 [Odontomachus brunneus]